MAGLGILLDADAYWERRQNGKCVVSDCLADAAVKDGVQQTRCEDCAKARNRAAKDRKLDRIVRKVCIYCEDPLSALLIKQGILSCPDCRKERSEKQEERRKPKRKSKNKTLCQQDGCKNEKYKEGEHTFSKCLVHLNRVAASIANLREDRIRDGLCPRCGRVPEPEMWGEKTKLWCKTCRTKSKKSKKEVPIGDATLV